MIGKIYTMESKTINKINRILFILLGIIVFVIILISLFHFLHKTNNTNKYRKIDNPTEIQKNIEYSLFSDFGRLRTYTCDTQQIPVVILPFLSYKSENTFLYEELCQKQRKIKSIILQYFTQKTQEELFSLGEEKVKLEILTQINDELSMGNIESIFFEEYLFLE